MLYEAATGQRYPARKDPKKVDWSRVPRFLRRPIRRAVQLEPDERWQDVASFAAALESAESRWRVRRTAVSAFVVAALVLIVAWYLATVSAPTLPTTSRYSPSDPSVWRTPPWARAWPASPTGRCRRARDITMTPRQTACTRLVRLPAAPSATSHRAHRPGDRSRYGVWGNVSPKGDLLEVRFSVVGEGGKPCSRPR